MKLTLYHDGQFWVGVVEEITNDGPVASRRVFGAEPADADILRFINEEVLALIRTATPARLFVPGHHSVNPKRAAREAAHAVRESGVSTFAQAALKADLESRAEKAQVIGRAQREQLALHKRELARLKAKARHRGH
jgi:hypothetical protein